MTRLLRSDERTEGVTSDSGRATFVDKILYGKSGFTRVTSSQVTEDQFVLVSRAKVLAKVSPGQRTLTPRIDTETTTPARQNSRSLTLIPCADQGPERRGARAGRRSMRPRRPCPRS